MCSFVLKSPLNQRCLAAIIKREIIRLLLNRWIYFCSLNAYAEKKNLPDNDQENG